MRYDAVIIGGGAAGLFCAIHAGRRGKKVLVIEHNAEVGRKIIISGGGRCNFTNLHTTHENFISANPHFPKSALAQFTPAAFLEMVRKHRIDHYEKKLGQLFCRNSSRQIVDMLLDECGSAGVKIRTACSVKSVARNGKFVVETNRGTIDAENLVVACGGLSFPKIGATDLGYRIARQFGLKIEETRPSLVAMVIDGKPFPELAGVAVDSAVSAGRASFRENTLFTHRGLSGPAILQISSYWRKGTPVTVDLLPDIAEERLAEVAAAGRKEIEGLLNEHLPHRLAYAIAARPLAASHNDPKGVASSIKNWEVGFRSTEGYDRAEVTLGGVSTHELSSKTMESKKVPGLYFIGEVVDVTGWLGGYNFQWAWASGYAAGNALE